MGTVGALENGSRSLPIEQPQSLVAYANKEDTATQDTGTPWTSNSCPDDRISHGDSGGPSEDIRPLSQGERSTNNGNGQSRPATSGAISSSALNPVAITPAVHGRPESSGTDGAPQPVMRHGFAEAYSSEEYLTMLEQVC